MPVMPSLLLLLLVALRAGASAPAGPLWDVAISRRPYISEAVGAILLRTDPALAAAGPPLRVVAVLPCVGRSWNWTVNVNMNSTEYVLPLDDLGSLPEQLNNDMIVNVSRDASATVSVRRRFQRAYKPTPVNTVQVDHATAGLRIDGEIWAGWGWYV
jgi:hypothetical protein